MDDQFFNVVPNEETLLDEERNSWIMQLRNKFISMDNIKEPFSFLH